MTNRIISVASSKGGIGKSTVSLGLARALADEGNRVLICDLDFGNACLDIMSGVEDEILYTVADLISGDVSAADAVTELQKDSLYLLPAPTGGKSECPDAERLCEAITEALDGIGADFAVLDTGAGVNAAANAVFSISDTVIVVSGHSPVSVRAAASTAERIGKVSDADVKLLINSFDTDNILKGRKKERAGMLEIIDGARASLIGVVPYDYELELKGDRPEYSYSPEVKAAFENIAARLQGENVPLFSGMRWIRKKKKILFS